MALHERDIHADDDDPAQPPWSAPIDHDVFTDGCPACEAARAAISMEFDLRQCSLRLWVAGWSPIELLDEVVRTTGLARSRDFMVQVLLVDDSHRSDQARTPEWTARIDALRAMTGISDVADGWFVRWAVANRCSVESECIANGTLRTLYDLLDPQVAA
ncbi:hypothetical protein [Ilumatobacter coccineus]|jgi:hypothetical protein|uniref:Uncharacterized protein n=1 Tax=Ilumatobacter coccineus (strain NBRC 103263 / KCTC 29153 / YM16-304) TaxID=1313172 RepID=A0A6C7EB03_ILUCY|nr:hypothetical protein [Ilumatobacter coccineus]BAN03917.1 hypothetical protein YM304_36030 [Ilumatobacter coccineus YM16-304]